MRNGRRSASAAHRRPLPLPVGEVTNVRLHGPLYCRAEEIGGSCADEQRAGQLHRFASGDGQAQQRDADGGGVHL